jgi:predicted RNA-binding Zn ribbon-like protein
MTEPAHKVRWDFDAGLQPLDFANTAEWRASPNPVEKLNNYADLVDWSLEAGSLKEEEAQHMLVLAERNPEKSAGVFREALRLREVIYHIFTAIVSREAPAPEMMNHFNIALAKAFSHARIEHSELGFAWTWTEARQDITRLLGPILQSTVELLTSKDLDRVGVCADDRGCGYLFFDSSRNRSRRWCSMESCGNRAKARRHYSHTKLGA